MKKLVIYIVISFFIFNLSNLEIYSNSKINQKNERAQFTSTEEGYINELTSLKNQLEIFSTNSIDAVINKKDKSKLLNESAYIKSQIRQLTLYLSQYHKEYSSDENKNPEVLAMLNTLNYYSMALSYITLFLNVTLPSDENIYLENYYFSKASGDQVLLWIKSQFKFND